MNLTASSAQWLTSLLTGGRPLLVVVAIVSWLWVSGAACWTLFRAYRFRQEEFIESLSDPAIGLYLEQWAPTLKPEQRTRAALSTHLKRTVPWGWGTPFVFVVLCGSAIAILVGFAQGEPWLTNTAASALAGGLMWVIFDQLGRLRRRDYTQADVASHSFRLLIAVPLGGALSAFIDSKLATGCALLLGAFPTTTLLKMGQRAVDRYLALGDLSNDGPHLDLERLQGVGRPEAERFAEEGIRSILQLAYTDPFLLAVRTNFDFDYVSDLVSQALLWTYATDDGLAKIQKLGLRGVIETQNLKRKLIGDDANAKASAQQILAQAALALGTSEPVLLNMLDELTADPYANLIFALWNDQ